MRAKRKVTAVALTILFSAGVAFAGASQVEPKGLWDSLMSLFSSPTVENVGGAGPVTIDRPGTQNVGGASPQLNAVGSQGSPIDSPRTNAVGNQGSPVGIVVDTSGTVEAVGNQGGPRNQ
jgi:hypothetical protein